MKKFELKNERGLVVFLSSHRCNYQVTHDGWAVLINCNSYQEFFNIGKMFGNWLANNPQRGIIYAQYKP